MRAKRVLQADGASALRRPAGDGVGRSPTASADVAEPEERGPSGWAFWVAVAAGSALIGYGVVGLLRNAADTHPLNFVVFFVGSALAHDLVLAPLAVAVGWFGLRRVPATARPAVAAALVVSGPVALYAYPFVRGYGRDPNNPSLLPNRYGWALVGILALVAVTAALWGWWTARHRRLRGGSPLEGADGEAEGERCEQGEDRDAEGGHGGLGSQVPDGLEA